MTSSPASTTTTNDTASSASFSVKSSVLCKYRSAVGRLHSIKCAFLDNFCSLFHSLFSSFNASTIHFCFVPHLNRELLSIKYNSVRSYNLLDNAFPGRSALLELARHSQRLSTVQYASSDLLLSTSGHRLLVLSFTACCLQHHLVRQYSHILRSSSRHSTGSNVQ